MLATSLRSKLVIKSPRKDEAKEVSQNKSITDSLSNEMEPQDVMEKVVLPFSEGIS